MQTTDFYNKKQPLSRATKSHKKIHEHHRTNYFWQNNTFKNLGAQEEAKYVEENCKKRVSGIKANVHTSKHAKVRNWAQKIRQAVFKSNAKNKATLQSHI